MLRDISNSESLFIFGLVDRISIASSKTLSSPLAKWASPVATDFMPSSSARSSKV